MPFSIICSIIGNHLIGPTNNFSSNIFKLTKNYVILVEVSDENTVVMQCVEAQLEEKPHKATPHE